MCERERRRLRVIIIIIQNVCPARLLLPARRSGLEFAFGSSRAWGKSRARHMISHATSP